MKTKQKNSLYIQRGEPPGWIQFEATYNMCIYINIYPNIKWNPQKKSLKREPQIIQSQLHS